MKIQSKTIFDKISNKTARKELFIIKLEPFWIYLQRNNWSAIDEIIFVFQEDSSFRELSPKDKVSLENAPVCYFIRNEKGGCGWKLDFKSFIGTWEMNGNVEYIC